MRTKLLSRADLQEILRCAEGQPPGEELLLCTIVDIVLEADLAKKGRSRLDWDDFIAGLARTQHRFNIASLDGDCLAEALFERADNYWVTGLWGQLGGHELSPDDTLRRIILRPSPSNWWEAELFDEIQA
jgi:hypothetical protein